MLQVAHQHENLTNKQRISMDEVANSMYNFSLLLEGFNKDKKRIDLLKTGWANMNNYVLE